MTTKRARLRKGKSGGGITLATSRNTRAKRKAATAKTTALTNGLAAAAKKAAAAAVPAKAPPAPKAVAGKTAKTK